MQSQKTNRQIIEFINFAQSYLAQNAEAESKFKYAISRMLKRCLTLHGKAQDQVEDINIQCCSVDDRGNILRDERNQYMFTKEQMVARTKAQRELMNKTVQIEAYISTDTPPSPLSPDDIEICEGFVLSTAAPLEVVANA